MSKPRSPKLLWAACGVLLLHTPVQAQLAVVDVGDIHQNTITAIQTTITAIQAVRMEANQVLDLANLHVIAVQQGGILQDLQLLDQLVTQAQGLSYDVNAVQAQVDALFGLPTAPTTSGALQQRLGQIRQLKYQSYSYAIRVQTLLRTALRTVDHLTTLMGTLTHLVGNLTGHETHTQTTMVATKHLANLETQIASFQRAQAVDRLEEGLTLEALTNINQHVYGP